MHFCSTRRIQSATLPKAFRQEKVYLAKKVNIFNKKPPSYPVLCHVVNVFSEDVFSVWGILNLTFTQVSHTTLNLYIRCI
jgi:hypothetical protein